MSGSDKAQAGGRFDLRVEGWRFGPSRWIAANVADLGDPFFCEKDPVFDATMEGRVAVVIAARPVDRAIGMMDAKRQTIPGVACSRQGAAAERLGAILEGVLDRVAERVDVRTGLRQSRGEAPLRLR